MVIALSSKKLNQQYETSKKAMETTEDSNSFNQNEVRLKKGNTYRLRLTHVVPDGGKSDLPIIDIYTHSVGKGDDFHNIICPTTSLGNAGFKKCKTCDYISELYKNSTVNGEWKSKDDNKLYSTLKRRLGSVMVVYVVSDPTNKENNGTFKILPFGKSVRDFISEEAFGIKPKKKKSGSKDAENENESGDDESEPVLQKAFDFESGYDLIISVTENDSNAEWNSYKPKFSRKETSIEIPEDAEEQIKALNFEGYMKSSTQEEVDSFYTKYVLGTDDGAEDEDDEDDEVEETTTAPSTSKAPKEEPKTTKAPVKDEEEDLGALAPEKKPEQKTQKAPKKVEQPTNVDDFLDSLN